MRYELHLLNLALLLSLAGLSLAQPGDGAGARIVPGDSFKLEIENVTEAEKKAIDGHYPISSEGIVTLPYIGKVKVKGMTAEQARDAIQGAYKNHNAFKDPRVKLDLIQP